MRAFAWMVLGVIVSNGACDSTSPSNGSGAAQGSGAPSSSDASTGFGGGSSSSGDGAGGAGGGSGGEAPCAADEKWCGACVKLDAPETGCAAASCSPCEVVHGSATCAKGVCALADCDAGYADCDGDPAACEAELASDPNHCGACAHGCAGDACANGLCPAFVLATNASGTYAEALASLGVDGTHVYYVGGTNKDHSLSAVAVDGASPPFVLNAAPTSYATVHSGNDFLFAAGENAVRALAKNEPTSLALDLAAGVGVSDLATNADSLFYARSSPSGPVVRRVSLSDLLAKEDVVTLPMGSSPLSLAADDAHVFFTTKSSVTRVSLADGASVELVSGLSLEVRDVLSLDANVAYFATSTELRWVSKDGVKSGSVLATPSPARSMASADGMLYWSDDDRRIWRVSASGGAPLLLRASDVVGSVVAVTVAGPYLVFIEQEPGFPQQGRILRVAR